MLLTKSNNGATFLKQWLQTVLIMRMVGSYLYLLSCNMYYSYSKIVFIISVLDILLKVSLFLRKAFYNSYDHLPTGLSIATTLLE